MGTPKPGRITRVELREVFPNEARDLTPWLEKNIDVVSECIGAQIVNAEREKAAGDFSADLVAETDDGKRIIIENQFNKSDHDHLGKLVTYLAMLEASAAIWIVEKPRPEHISAVSWLNEAASNDFYLVKLEAIRIDNSNPAPLLTLIVGPSEETKAAGNHKREDAERHVARRKFWTDLLAYARKKTDLHSNTSPGRNNWLATGAGVSGLRFAYLLWEHETGIELFIEKSRESENKSIFDALILKKQKIEERFGAPLVWERMDGSPSSKIQFLNKGRGWKDPDHWPTTIEHLVDQMIRFESALRPHLDELGRSG